MTSSTFNIDALDVRSSRQRALDRAETIARKLDALRLTRNGEPHHRRYLHLTAAQQAAVRQGARDAYNRFGHGYVPEDWQSPRRPTMVTEDNAIAYANTHPQAVARSWQQGGAPYLRRHVRLRMTEQMARALKPRKHQGEDVIVMPWGAWTDLEAQYQHEVASPRLPDGSRRIRPVTPRHAELRPMETITEADIARARKGIAPRTPGGRVARQIPAGVARSLRAALDPGDARPSGPTDPSDPTGDAATTALFHEHIRDLAAIHGIADLLDAL